MAISDEERRTIALRVLDMSGEDLEAMDGFERADALRATAAISARLTRQVRHMTVLVRDKDDMTWGTISSLLTGSPHARSTARSTYEAGLRQLGRISQEES